MKSHLKLAERHRLVRNPAPVAVLRPLRDPNSSARQETRLIRAGRSFPRGAHGRDARYMSLMKVLRFASADLAIDLGTANTVVYLRDRGVVLAEPSVVAIETINGVQKVRAVGDDAKLMLGRTPENLKTIRPLRNGVIADLEVAEHMIKHFVTKARAKNGTRRLTSPEIVICVPSGSTAVGIPARIIDGPRERGGE